MEKKSVPTQRLDTLKPEEVLRHQPEETIVLTDIARNGDDMTALVLAAFLRDSIRLKAVIPTLAPVVQRAKTARYTLNGVGLSNTPIGVGSNTPYKGAEKTDQAYQFEGLPPEQPEEQEKAVDVIEYILNAAIKEGKKINFLAIATFTDLAKYLERPGARDLFKKVVKKVVIMGGVATKDGKVVLDKENDFLLPDTSANYEYDSNAAKEAFTFFQESQIPMVLISRFAASVAALPRETFDVLDTTGHPIGHWLKNTQEKALTSLYNRACLPVGNPERGEMPDRCDEAWFVKTFCEGNALEATKPFWEQIKKIPVGDPLAMLACSPAHVEQFFDPTIVTVYGTEHTLIGVSSQQTGVKDGEALQKFMSDGLVSVLNSSMKDG